MTFSPLYAIMEGWASAHALFGTNLDWRVKSLQTDRRQPEQHPTDSALAPITTPRSKPHAKTPVGLFRRFSQACQKRYETSPHFLVNTCCLLMLLRLAFLTLCAIFLTEDNAVVLTWLQRGSSLLYTAIIVVVFNCPRSKSERFWLDRAEKIDTNECERPLRLLGWWRTALQANICVALLDFCLLAVHTDTGFAPLCRLAALLPFDLAMTGEMFSATLWMLSWLLMLYAIVSYVPFIPQEQKPK